jgi:SAM-dependent methyltransferase
MDREIYRRMRDVEHQHWWFRGRRRILAKVLDGLHLPRDAAILDVGCGTGGNLEMLSHVGRVTGLEMDAEARGIAAEKGVAPILAGSFPDAVPFPEESFDLVTMLDVLEHVEHDGAALAMVAGLLRSGGLLLLTVPAYGFIWSEHDEVHHHKRRYTRVTLRGLVSGAGLTVRYATYFNTWLLAPILIARGAQRLLPARPTEVLPLPPPWINRMLECVFASERFLLGRWSLPAGVSILLVAQRSAGSRAGRAPAGAGTP